jgi:nucleoid-associated protein YgaU
MFRRGLMLLLVAVVCAGCQPASRPVSTDPDFETEDFKKAREKFELRDFIASIDLYEKVLRENPKMAKAHLALGRIYDDKQSDFVSAIYHYKRYLRLKPDGDTARQVEEWITRAENQLALKAPNSPVQNSEELARVQKENLGLKAEIEDLKRAKAQLKQQLDAAGLAAATPEPAAPAPVPETTPAEAAAPEPPKVVPLDKAMTGVPKAVPVAGGEAKGKPAPGAAAAPAAAPRSYVIQPGDSMTKIAKKMYPKLARGEAIQKIMEANKETVSDPAKIRAGQTLVIP